MISRDSISSRSGSSIPIMYTSPKAVVAGMTSDSSRSLILLDGRWRLSRLSPGCASSSTTTSPASFGIVKKSIMRSVVVFPSGNVAIFASLARS